jgi:hypothetical protein
LQGPDGTLRDPCQPGLQRRTLLRAHASGKVLGEVDGLGHVRVLRAQLGERLGVLLGALLLMPYYQPGRLTSGEEPLVGLGHHRQRLLRPSALGCLALRLAHAWGVTGDGGIAARRAPLLQRALEAPGITAAGVPPVQEIRCIRIEATVAPVTASPALGQGGWAQRAKHRLLADAELGRNGLPRPPLVGQRPHRLLALTPARPTLDRLLLSGRGRGWDSDSDGTVRHGHPLTTDGIMDGCERLVMRGEHLLEGLHQILEQVKPVGDLRGLGCPVARPIGIGSGSVARDDLDPRVGPQPLGQGLGLPVGQPGARWPAFQIDQDGPIRLAFAQGEIVDAQDPWCAVARDRQATDHAERALAAEWASQAPTETHAGGPAQREPDGDQPGHQALRLPSPGRHHPREPFREEATGTWRVGTEELADAELPSDAGHAPGQISERACVSAVDASGTDGANWTGHEPLGRGHVQGYQRGGVVDLPRVEVE